MIAFVKKGKGKGKGREREGKGKGKGRENGNQGKREYKSKKRSFQKAYLELFTPLEHILSFLSA